MQASHHFTIFADYFQFIVMDESSEDDFASIWTKAALERMVAVGQRAICPGTLRNVDVEVEIKVRDDEPAVQLANFDHAVEASIDVPSGKLMVVSCTGDFDAAPRLEIPAGSYQVLFLVQGVETIKEEWSPADDRYIVYLWPGRARQPRLLKHWERSDA